MIGLSTGPELLRFPQIPEIGIEFLSAEVCGWNEKWGLLGGSQNKSSPGFWVKSEIYGCPKMESRRGPLGKEAVKGLKLGEGRMILKMGCW